MKRTGVYLALAALAAASLAGTARATTSDLELLAQSNTQGEMSVSNGTRNLEGDVGDLGSSMSEAEKDLKKAINNRNYDAFIEVQARLTFYKILELEVDGSVMDKRSLAIYYLSNLGRYISDRKNIEAQLSSGQAPSHSGNSWNPCITWKLLSDTSTRLYGSFSAVMEKSPTLKELSGINPYKACF